MIVKNIIITTEHRAYTHIDCNILGSGNLRHIYHARALVKLWPLFKGDCHHHHRNHHHHHHHHYHHHYHCYHHYYHDHHKDWSPDRSTRLAAADAPTRPRARSCVRVQQCLRIFTYFIFVTFFTQPQFESWKFYTWKCVNPRQKLRRDKTA